VRPRGDRAEAALGGAAPGNGPQGEAYPLGTRDTACSGVMQAQEGALVRA